MMIALLTSLCCLMALSTSIALLDEVTVGVYRCSEDSPLDSSQFFALDFGDQVSRGISLRFNFQYDREEPPEWISIVLSAMSQEGRDIPRGALPRMATRYTPPHPRRAREYDLQELPFDGKEHSLELFHSQTPNSVYGEIDVIPGGKFGVDLFLRDQDRAHLESIILLPYHEVLYPID